MIEQLGILTVPINTAATQLSPGAMATILTVAMICLGIVALWWFLEGLKP